MNKKGFLLFLMVSSLSYAAEDNLGVIHEIQDDKLLRQTVSVAARVVHNHSDIKRNEIFKIDQPLRGKDLSPYERNKFFHSAAGEVLDAYCSSFRVGKTKGCVYTIDDEKLKDKVFIVFSGSQNEGNWLKNLLGIYNFDHNIQQSYYDNVNSLFSSESEFDNILKKHIESERKRIDSNRLEKQEINESEEKSKKHKSYEYYFIGHSKDGSLALLAAQKFKKEKSEFIGNGKVKVVTFCAPRLTNAHKKQFDLIQELGFCNIAHFISPSDVVPKFPFKFVENYGVKIPLKSSWSIKKSHEIPDEQEIEWAVKNFNEIKSLGWTDPIRSLFTLEIKPVLWGLGGMCFSSLLSRHVKMKPLLDIGGEVYRKIWKKLRDLNRR